MNIRARNLLFAQFGVVAIVGGLHLFGTVNFLYWRLPWFDLVTHFLAGIWAGIFVAWLLALAHLPPRLILCITAALILGVIWEYFEATNYIIKLPKESLDTAKDLFMDILGGFAAYFLVREIVRQ